MFIHESNKQKNRMDERKTKESILGFYSHNIHAYQSLAFETAIDTDFSELFSMKRIYVKYNK